MPTVLDELVIRLGLDSRAFQTQVQQTRTGLGQVGAVARRESSKLEEELRKVHVETGRRMEQVGEVGRHVGQQLSSVKSNVLGLLGAVAGAYGLQQFISNLVGADAALGNFSKALGLNTEDVATWIEMGKSVGTSADSMKTAIVALSQTRQEYILKGTISNLGEWNALGIDPRKAKDEFDLIKQISAWAEKQPPERARALLQPLGITPEMIPLLMKGRAELEKLETAKRSLGVATAKSAEEDQNFINKLNEIRQAIENIGRVVLSDFHKPIMEALGAMKDWLALNQKDIVKTIDDAIRGAIPAIKEFSKEVVAFVKYLGTWKESAVAFSETVGKIPDHFRNWSTTMETLAAAAGPFFIAMAAGFGPILAAVVAITAALTVLEKKMDPKEYPVGSPLFRGMSEAEQLLYPNSPASIKKYGYPGGGSGSWLWDKLSGMFGGAPSSQESQEFFDKTFNDLKTEAEKRNLPHPEVIASLGASQASHESASGTSDLARRANNLFGIKPGTPGGVGETGQSGEYVTFASREASAKGYLDFITKNPRYADVLNAPTVADAANRMAKTGYAEDPAYLSGIQNQYMRHRPNIPNTGPTFGPQLQVGPPVPSVPQAPPTLPVPPLPPPPAAATSPTNTDNSKTSSIDTHISGPITIHTAATDPEGIARGIGGALQRYNYVPQMNTGLA